MPITLVAQTLVARIVPGSCYALWSEDFKTLGLKPMALATIGAEGPNRYDPFRRCIVSRHHLPFPAIAVGSKDSNARCYGLCVKALEH